MMSTKAQDGRNGLWTRRLLLFLLLPAISGAGQCECKKRDEDGKCVNNPGRTFVTILKAAWLAGGNSILTVDTANGNSKTYTVDFTQDNWPPLVDAGSTFISGPELGSTAKAFKLECGAVDGDDLETTIVFWSDSYWSGQAEVFDCGGTSGTHVVESPVGAAASLCLFTSSAPSNIVDRCLNGPTCDDQQKNQGESDVDCGGSSACSRCRAGMSCSSGSHCSSGICTSDVCRDPTCDDGLQNGSETGVDCGGSDCAACTCSGQTPSGNVANYFVVLEDWRGCAEQGRYYRANSLSEAKNCAASDGYDVVNVSNGYQMNLYVNGNMDTYHPEVCAATPDKALSCAKYKFCSNCSSIEVAYATRVCGFTG